MATAVIAGLSVSGYAVGAGATASAAIAIGMAAATATTIAEKSIEAHGQLPEEKLDLSVDEMAPIDKRTIQEKAKVPELQLGESVDEKIKRKTGKEEFKVDLDDSEPLGIQLDIPKDTGVQL